MNKYWMVYRPSKRRELGEDFSSRQPQIDAEPAAPAEPVPSRFKLFLQTIRGRIRRRVAVSQPLPNVPKHS